MNVIPFHRPVPRTCTVCGGGIRATAPAWHKLCRTCYEWRLFGLAIERFRRARQ